LPEGQQADFLGTVILPVLFLLQAQFQSPRLIESSGVAASRAHPGILWTHNDSGDGPYLYATDLAGRDLGFLLVPGAEASDWEDMALGPCPPPGRAASCVYLADTGDNPESRPWVTVYAVPEPRPPTGPGDTLRTTAAPAVLRLRYPDGPHDVEAIYVSPRDSAVYLVSKGRSGGIRLYRVSRAQWEGNQDERHVATAALIQTLDIRPSIRAGRLATGAAMRPDGRLVAVRTYTEIYLFAAIAGGRLVPARARPCSIAVMKPGGGGEAIDFLDDSTLVLTTEALQRRAGSVHRVTCRSD
jgi:hypothetical protein